MDEKKTGGHAFPGFNYVSSNVHDGMTLRDYFAAAALTSESARFADGHPNGRDGIAAAAYAMADAMLKAREA